MSKVVMFIVFLAYLLAYLDKIGVLERWERDLIEKFDPKDASDKNSPEN